MLQRRSSFCRYHLSRPNRNSLVLPRMRWINHFKPSILTCLITEEKHEEIIWKSHSNNSKSTMCRLWNLANANQLYGKPPNIPCYRIAKMCACTRFYLFVRVLRTKNVIVLAKDHSLRFPCRGNCDLFYSSTGVKISSFACRSLYIACLQKAHVRNAYRFPPSHQF